ncbi:MAG: hypothetical protein HYW47_03165 [Deltaproteobacteria bacterium]|nr:hypothetical protein [Deltaproteobacteria bacterium]
MSKYLKLFYFFCFVLTSSSFASSNNLSWEAWVMGKKLMNIEVDSKGNIHVVLYNEDKELESKYYYTTQDYTCAQSLKKDFEADCQSTCFPSYNQKGIDFFLTLPDQAETVCTQKVEDIKYEGYKSKLYEIECPIGKAYVTVIPELGEYQDLIHQGSNNYFKNAAEVLKIKGFISQVKMQDKNRETTMFFYETKNLKLNSNTSLIHLPQGFHIIETGPFMKKMQEIEKKVMIRGQKYMNELFQQEDAQVKLELLAVKNECKTRYPAHQDEILLMEVCRQNPEMRMKIENSVGDWKNKIRNKVNTDIKTEFTKETAQALEAFCKK